MESLLALLQDGAFHSGEALGDRLGVSRSAVWKQLKKLESEGIRVESVRGKGYRLDPAIQLLDLNRLQEGLKTAGVQQARVVINRLTQSTNDDASELCRAGLSGFPVVLAEHQASGRGRRGRQWVGRFGANVYMSAVWRSLRGAQAFQGLSLVAGVSVIESLGSLGYSDVKLKWPNDLLVQKKKLAGILVEIKGDMLGECFAIIGLGLNLHLDCDELKEIDQPAVCLADLVHGAPDKTQVVQTLIEHLYKNLKTFDQFGFAPFKARWQQHDAYRGAELKVSAGSHTVYGVGCGITDDGSYLIETDAGPYYCQGGEISLRERL